MVNPQGKKILLVEDEVIIAMAVKKQLEKYGYYVTRVASGEEAVRLSLEKDAFFDVILMDIDFGPGIDGTQAAKRFCRLKISRLSFYLRIPRRPSLKKRKRSHPTVMWLKTQALSFWTHP